MTHKRVTLERCPDNSQGTPLDRAGEHIRNDEHCTQVRVVLGESYGDDAGRRYTFSRSEALGERFKARVFELAKGRQTKETMDKNVHIVRKRTDPTRCYVAKETMSGRMYLTDNGFKIAQIVDFG